MSIQEKKDASITLQLGDVIKIVAPTNEELNNNTYIIDYIDRSKMILINTTTFTSTQIRIGENGVLGDKTITAIYLISRSEQLGYARQNNLVVGTWIEIYIAGDVPTVITGLITNLEEDMIEIKTYPDNQIIYLNFDYKGIPENIPIESITIREKPESVRAEVEELVADKLEEGEILEEKEILEEGDI